MDYLGVTEALEKQVLSSHYATFGARAKRESNSNAALFSACTRPNASIILICVICHFHVFYIFMLIYDLIWERHIILSSKSHSRIKVVMNSENCLVFTAISIKVVHEQSGKVE
jgi:hypothetical protein